MMRRKKDENSFQTAIIKIILSVTLIFFYTSPSRACTSFAVYGSKIFYGMNFDYPDVELKFVITTSGEFKIFQALFVQNGNTSAICGMNSKGLFSSIQMLYPEVTSWTTPQPPAIIDLYGAYTYMLANSSDLEYALNIMNLMGIKVIHVQGTTLHNFFADKYGKAYVLEVGEDKNFLTPAENNFLVMTNFPNNQFIGKPLDEINGVGADRYKTAFQYIQTNKDTFSFNNGLETLQKTVQANGDYKTQVSLLFDPATNEIFIVLKRDFTKIWKVSINDGTIETYQGFTQHQKIPIPETGISASELQNIVSVNDNSDLIPNSIKLYQNYPNPFNPTTAIKYSIPAVETRHVVSVQLKVYDVLGNEIATLVDGYKPAGEYTINFDASSVHGGLSSGTYIYCLKAGGFIATRKLILLK
jgi:hypothetical protein